MLLLWRKGASWHGQVFTDRGDLLHRRLEHHEASLQTGHSLFWGLVRSAQPKPNLDRHVPFEGINNLQGRHRDKRQLGGSRVERRTN